MYTDLPLVEFEYPDSDTNHQKVRYVRVLTMDDQHVTGYELPHHSATKDGKFKKYCLSRIVRLGVHLIQFAVKV